MLPKMKIITNKGRKRLTLGLRHGYKYKTSHFVRTLETNLSKLSPLVDKEDIFWGGFGGHLKLTPMFADSGARKSEMGIFGFALTLLVVKC